MYNFDQLIAKYESEPQKGERINVAMTREMKSSVQKHASIIKISPSALVRLCIRIGISQLKLDLKRKEVDKNE